MRTIKERFINEIVIQKSRFISILLPVDNKDDVKEILNELKKEFPKATHYCYAYIIDSMMKSNDDGEPTSTAGRPILETMIHHSLNCALLVVIRYFGGIKLGAGGLTRAYVDSASEVIKKAQLYEYEKRNIYSIKVKYENSEILKRYLNQKNIEIIDIKYDDNIEYIISSALIDEMDLKDYMQGKIEIIFIKEDIVLVKR